MSLSKSLNKAALLNLYNIGGKEMVLRLIDRFLQSTPERMETARRQAVANDFRSLHLLAHSLKATAANLGTDRFRDLAEQLEECAGQGKPDGLQDLLNELETGWEETEAQLQSERMFWRT